MFIVILFLSSFISADYSLDIGQSKLIDTKIHLNGYEVNSKSLINFVKVGTNDLKVCFKKKSLKPISIKNHVRVELKDNSKKDTDILVSGGLQSIKAIPLLSFYSLQVNSDFNWTCETKNFVHSGNNYLYYYLSTKDTDLNKKSAKKIYNTKKYTKKFNVKKSTNASTNAIDSHQRSIKSAYNNLKNIKLKPVSQANRNIRALVGTKKKPSILGSWKDVNTGVVYLFKPKLIEVSNMPKGFHMDYKKIGSNRLRVKVLNNKFDLIYKLKSHNKMLQKNTQSGVTRELIRL